MGPRKARSDGVPLQSYRRDALSASYRRQRAAQAADAEARARARRDRARRTAADAVAVHGYHVVVEDCSIAAWSTSWGRAVAAFSPATLITAIDREARAVATLARGAGGVDRASTRTTALSQHCPCGARVDKRLRDRVHRCTHCGLTGDRDAIAAVLASFVVLDRRDVPSSARVDYDASSDALGDIRRVVGSYSGWQDTLSESIDLSARDGSFVAWWTSTPDSVAVARRTLAWHRAQPGMSLACQTTSERVCVRTNLFRRNVHWTYLRDTS